MSTSTSTGLPHTRQRVLVNSRRMRRLCTALIVLLPVALAVYWAVADERLLALHANLPPQAVGLSLLPWQRLAAAAVGEAALALLLLGLWQARSCFAAFARGEVFTAQAVQRLRRFAAWTLASTLGSVVAGAATSVIISWGMPAGQRHLAIAVGSAQLFTVFVAGMVWLMAAVMGQGQALADENAGFV